ncbi:hypothetical protein JW930_05475 [Candidatus Woesearchaeota archaeon]|nr:hypothetical protein [Candidatus Woesearchaeota archaeon]
MRHKIGVMGSHEEPKDRLLIKRSREIGERIAKKGCILVNGATSGFPDEAAYGAKNSGGFVLGISPAHDIHEHEKKFKLPTKNYSTIVFTGFGFNLRNIINIRTCDAVIFIRGSFGTLNEFTIAYEDGKIIGILEHSGGISAFFDELISICEKNTGAKVIYEQDPKKLVDRLLEEIKKG